MAVLAVADGHVGMRLTAFGIYVCDEQFKPLPLTFKLIDKLDRINLHLHSN